MPAEKPSQHELRARLCWWLIAFVGFAFAVGPAVTHGSLTVAHIFAHLVTGPMMTTLALLQLYRLRNPAAHPHRSIDWLLAVLGLWLIALPFVVPAAGLHIHGHAAAGVAVTAAASWNAVRPPSRRL